MFVFRHVSAIDKAQLAGAGAGGGGGERRVHRVGGTGGAQRRRRRAARAPLTDTAPRRRPGDMHSLLGLL